jgi:hypothetical protein
MLLAAVGLFVAVMVGMFVRPLIAGTERQQYWGAAVLVPLALLALYFLIRIIHWAWITPMPVPSS